MRALVVYESAWGNTRQVATAIGSGLRPHVATEVVDVADAPSAAHLDVDLVVLGGPTHAFGLSRPGTRQDAHRKGATLVVVGLREWLAAAQPLGCAAAAFDTHVRHPNLPGSASGRAAKALRRLGCTLLLPPESFFVEGYEGPLLPGELDRAEEWGARLATCLPSGADQA